MLYEKQIIIDQQNQNGFRRAIQLSGQRIGRMIEFGEATYGFEDLGLPCSFRGQMLHSLD